jgi:hypothetical protein
MTRPVRSRPRRPLAQINPLTGPGRINRQHLRGAGGCALMLAWRQIPQIALPVLWGNGMFVRAVVVEDRVDQLASRHGCLDGVEEADELLVAMALHAPSQHGAVEDVQGRKERGGAVARVVVGRSPGWVRSRAWICWGGWSPHGISVPRWWLSKVTNGEPSAMDITTIGLDLAKHVFQVHGVAADGSVALKKRLRRGQVLAFFARLPPCLVGMEACATAHFWARQLLELGHQRV